MSFQINRSTIIAFNADNLWQSSIGLVISKCSRVAYMVQEDEVTTIFFATHFPWKGGMVGYKYPKYCDKFFFYISLY